MLKTKYLVLSGSGEFTTAMEETDRILLTRVRENTGTILLGKIKTAIIPTAAGLERDNYKWVVKGINHFTKLGAIPSGFEILSRKDSGRKKHADRIKQFQFMYFSGGNPGYLFEVLNNSVFWKSVHGQYKKGAVLAGSSAGAMIMGNFVLGNIYDTFEKNGRPGWVKGFGLVPFAIIPHFDHVLKKEKQKFEKMKANTPKKILSNFLGIDEDTALIIENEKSARVHGKGKVLVVRNGKGKIYKKGEGFEIK